jgi:RNAse (barnase) inhibitor barstar
MQVERKRQILKQQSFANYALQTHDMDDELDALSDNTFTTTELNVTLTFKGLNFFESIKKVMF